MKKGDYPNGNEQEEEEDEEIELSLGLSLNGRFGVDPTINKKLKRSCSVANMVFAVGGAVENGAAHHPRGAESGSHAPLWRTQSLPTETEEDWRRRKELQSMRRMEARKKRMEKLKNSRVLRDKEIVFSKDVRNGKNGSRVDNSISRRFENGDVMDSSQGSIGPPRRGSSGSSDLKHNIARLMYLSFLTGSRPKQTAEAPPSRLQSPPQEQEPGGRAPDREAKGCSGVSLKNGMFDMPYVTTKETGPNGRKIEGFLYRYKKGEEVRIVCVCHGTFLTPKEFVAHGGGGEVEQPLKHIVVNPFPLF
ncbi:ninja-family protein afp3 [Phtheirospermum japonicum]|uniref:Ninja-family protein n=1 Tax=Phtheirospermum japonicum TaxID=374723 RepID=A0A830BCH7_9LAMI|nr:ninja-family protein afp3 [Phtheirospermum japonicum]